jgi:hypothetical protein
VQGYRYVLTLCACEDAPSPLLVQQVLHCSSSPILSPACIVVLMMQSCPVFFPLCLPDIQIRNTIVTLLHCTNTVRECPVAHSGAAGAAPLTDSHTSSNLDFSPQSAIVFSPSFFRLSDTLICKAIIPFQLCEGALSLHRSKSHTPSKLNSRYIMYQKPDQAWPVPDWPLHQKGMSCVSLVQWQFGRWLPSD